jgi:hypothetical protein
MGWNSMTQSIPEVGSNIVQINNAEFVKVTIFNEYPYTDAANITANTTYIIKTSGNTNWTAVGAASNAIGTYFTANLANGNATGNGTAANVTVLTFSSSYKEETIPQYIGNTIVANYVYDPLGGLLSVGSQNRNLRVTSGETIIALSGIDGNNIYNVLATNIRGSEVEVLRGFYNNNMVLGNTYNRFKGIITSYAISEDRDEQEDNFTVSVSASSYKTILENRLAGRKTNKESWRYFDSNDSSMDQVYAISGVNFDFGQTPKAGTVVPGGGGFPGGGGGGGGGRGFDDFNQNDR